MIPKGVNIAGGRDVEPENWKPNTKYFYTVATSAGWSHQSVKDLMLFHFKRTSAKDLRRDEYDKLLEMFDTLPANSISIRDENTEDMFE